MKVKKKLIISLIFVAMLLTLKNVSYAGTQKWNSLDYNVTVNDDGSMDVVETWDIYVSETNTLFKDFELDSSKYSGITDVKVINANTGVELTQIDEEMYHVTKDCYYGLPISGGKFEIAWGVGLDNSSANRKYAISYKIEDAVTVYNDCSELYWQFLGTDNSISADRVTGIIKLPKEVNDIEKLRVWAHGPLNGEIRKSSNDTVTFTVDDFDSKTMLEVRVVTEEPIFRNTYNNYSYNKLDEILEEEIKWADEANWQRKKNILIFFAILVIYCTVFIIFFRKIIKYKKQLKEIKSKYRKNEIDIGKYFRDIPREKDSTPAQAAFLYYSIKNNFAYFIFLSDIFSAMLLQLCLKKRIALEKQNNEIKIIFKDNETIPLKDDETIILNLIKKAAQNDDSITIEKLKLYAKKEYDEFREQMEKMGDEAKKEYIKSGMYILENEKELKSIQNKIAIYVGAMVFSFCLGPFIFFALPIIIEFLICSILLSKISKNINVLTEEGEIERQQWIGLKKYMEEFSLLKERDIPDLVLWEKYLIYATAFGISEKVIEQLKVVYPHFNEMNEENTSFMYLMNDSHYGHNFIKDVNTSFNSVYNEYRSAYDSAHSSGSGGGGGFSSGGGGRRWRRPDAVEDKVKCLIKKFKVKS